MKGDDEKSPKYHYHNDIGKTSPHQTEYTAYSMTWNGQNLNAFLNLGQEEFVSVLGVFNKAMLHGVIVQSHGMLHVKRLSISNCKYIMFLHMHTQHKAWLVAWSHARMFEMIA